jgi:hypothetical protein
VKISRDEVLWAAGFFEGEGAISTRSAIVSQVNKWPLERLMATFGGNLGKTRRSSNSPNAQMIYQWAICGEECRLFISLIYPHLSPKRQQQIDDKFITEEKRQRIRSSFRQGQVIRSLIRTRDEKGRYL